MPIPRTFGYKSVEVDEVDEKESRVESEKSPTRTPSFSKADFAFAACNLFQFSAMMSDKASGANYQNYLHAVNGDKSAVVSLMANLASSSQIVSFVIGPLVGDLSDSMGRKPVLIGSQLVMALCWYLRDIRSWSNQRLGFYVSVAGRLISGLAFGAFMGTRVAALSDMYTGRRLALAYSYLTASMGAAYVCGPLLFVPWVGKSVKRAFLVRYVCNILSAGAIWYGLKETHNNNIGGGGCSSSSINSSAIKRKRGISNPLSFLKLFSTRWSLGYLTVAQALQKLVSPAKSLSSAVTWHVQQVIQFTPLEYGRIITMDGLGMMLGTNFTKRYLPRLGELTFVTLCNVCLSFTLLLRSRAKTNSKTSKLLFLASLLPMIGGDQCYVVVDSAVIQRGAACGLGKGEMSAMLDNVTALVYIFASAMWSRLFKRDPILPLQVAACIALTSTVPYSLGMRAAKIEDEEDEKKRRN